MQRESHEWTSARRWKSKRNSGGETPPATVWDRMSQPLWEKQKTGVPCEDAGLMDTEIQADHSINAPQAE